MSLNLGAPRACQCPHGTIPEKLWVPGSLTNEHQHSAQCSALGRTLEATSRQFPRIDARISSRMVAGTGEIASADETPPLQHSGAGVARHVVVPLNRMYLSGPILVRFQCYDVSAFHQRQTLITTFHMTLNSMHDATCFLDMLPV